MCSHYSQESLVQSEPQCARTLIWALPISLAATLEIDVSFSSSGYLVTDSAEYCEGKVKRTPGGE